MILRLIVTNENQSSGLHTRFFDCCWVDALKATVGNSFRRYLIHFSTMSFDTKSMTRQNINHVRVCAVTNSWKWWSKFYIFLPILLSTKTIFLFVPLWITACSTWGHLQPRGSRASKTSKITSDASITYEEKKHNLKTNLLDYVSECIHREDVNPSLKQHQALKCLRWLLTFLNSL